MINPKMWAIVAAAFIAGAFVASPELRAYASTIANDVVCSGCVGTSDLAGNAVTAAKIKDGEVKAAEIAANAVGASELKGVSKLIFSECTVAPAGTFIPGGTFVTSCSVPGAAFGDNAVATANAAGCYGMVHASPGTDVVTIRLVNDCSVNAATITTPVSIIVYNQ